jgi:hypothetical protein
MGKAAIGRRLGPHTRDVHGLLDSRLVERADTCHAS